ncbi:MAG TPA: hypothetical protein VJ976_04965 [Ornithinimicrobium sp.]|uniref:hypothetical protein n=1 Tax=Ornithinimicrobium sp. TaxID=1977084 RepID=UPI002B478BF8|nr:hypothetical protein [Ornithinimicrobium sp.]HKJ11724.1 hypothetical protein [Ornithinimicrobium sp.]
MLWLFKKAPVVSKSPVERAAGAVAKRVDGKKLVSSGLGVIGSLASVTAASAAVSAVRKRELS